MRRTPLTGFRSGSRAASGAGGTDAASLPAEPSRTDGRWFVAAAETLVGRLLEEVDEDGLANEAEGAAVRQPREHE